MSSPSFTASATAIPSEELQRALLSRIGDFRMMPDVAQEALEIVKDTDCSTARFAAVVERDIPLATSILSMANSAAFSSGRTVASLHQAVARLGFQRCRNLIISSGMAGLMQQMSLEQQWVREQLWKHGFTTAMIGLHLNRLLKLGFQGEEFTAGLMHDIGRTLFAVAAHEVFSTVDALEFDEDPSPLDNERHVYGTDHCDFGAWFAARSGVPELLVDAIRYHHVPTTAARNQTLVALTAAADHMANYLQRDEEPESYELNGNQALLILTSLSRHSLSSEVAPFILSVLRSVQDDLGDLAKLMP